MTSTTVSYKWLQEELSTIKTSRFHVVEGGGSEALRTANRLDLPRSYREFVQEFGKAKLYKVKGGYALGVLAAPSAAVGPDGVPLLCVGHYQSAKAYFKQSELAEVKEPPVYEWGQAGLRKSADGFASWLENRCSAARSQYGKRGWARVLKGPKPFTEREEAVVQARRDFKWRVVGVTPDNDLIFEVTNCSGMTLPFVSIGVRSSHGKFEGRVWLPVSHIGSGTTGVIEKDCYKRYVDPEQIEVFALPDPEPEDRDEYWEFREVGLLGEAARAEQDPH